MKKHFTIKSVLIALLAMVSCTMKAEIVEYTTDDGFAYSLDTETQEASLVGYRGDATEVVIPESVTYEGKEYKVTSLGDDCFWDRSSLTSIEIPSSVTSLGDDCFYGCSSLTSVEIPSSVTSLGAWCFSDCSSLASIDLSSSVTSLGYECFKGCSSLTSIEIPSSVTSLGKGCLYGCSSLESIVVDANNPVYDSREGCNAIIERESNTMIAVCKSTRIPSSVTSLGNECFKGCSSLTSIEIPSSVTSLGYACFCGCSSLTSVEIPSSVTSLEDNCFWDCSSLESIVVDANNPVYDSREGCNAIIETESNTMISGCKGTRIPSSVTSLGDACFSGCSSLTSVEIPSSVTSLEDNCFWDCSSLESIVVDANNPVYDSREGCNAIIERESNTMIAACKSTRIPSSVTSLGNNCFYNCSSLTSIEIPSSVTSLGYDCFSGCSSLTSVEIPSSVTSLGSGCFEYCSSLTSVEIPSSVTSLGYLCFYGCSSLTSVEIPSSVTSLGDFCFNGCSSLTSIEIPSSVTSLGYCCFYGCSSLKTVICKMGNVIKDSSLFERFPIEDATLYVPEGRLGTYKSTDPWSGFGTILPWTEELEVSVDDTPELGIALKTNNGNVMVSGLADGTPVSCYTLNGRLLGKASADGGTATFTAEPNSVVIVKVGKKSFKVYVK